MAKLDSGAMTIGNNDNWREIFDDQNATAVAANQATADLAPIINGKRCALSVASGGFVLLRNSTITGKADGAYTAAKAIPANTDLDGSYLTAVSGGVANALNSKTSNVSGTITKADGTNYINNIAIFCRKVAGLFVCTGYFNVATSIPSSTNFARLNDIVPSNLVYCCVYKNGGNAYSVRIGTNGIISSDDVAIPTGYYNVLIVGACN